MLIKTLERNLIKSTYGHKYTIPEIKLLYPFSNKPFNKTLLNNQKLIITYNPMQAVQLRKNHQCIGWGLQDKSNYVFVFKRNKKDIEHIEINF